MAICCAREDDVTYRTRGLHLAMQFSTVDASLHQHRKASHEKEHTICNFLTACFCTGDAALSNFNNDGGRPSIFWHRKIGEIIFPQ
jgi:hypothetical protein